MMQKKGSDEGSQNPNQSSRKHDRNDEKKLLPFKKRARFLCSDDDFKKASQSKNSSAINAGPRRSSTSGRKDAAEKNKSEIVPIEKKSSSTTDDKDASLPPLARRKLEGAISSLAMSTGKERCVKKTAEDKDPAKAIVSTTVRKTAKDKDQAKDIVSTTVRSISCQSEPRGDGDSKEGEPRAVSNRKQANKNKGGDRPSTFTIKPSTN